MARVLEADALALFRRAGLDVPDWAVAATAAEARDAAARFGGRAVVKALIPTGGRGKAGAVRLVSNPDQAEALAATLLGTVVSHFPVERVLVSAAVAIAQELFVSFAFDSTRRAPLLLFSTEGGVEVEGISEAALIRRPIDIRRGLRPFEAREVAAEAGLTGRAQTSVAAALAGLYQVFAETEAETLEVNPLVVTPDQRAMPVTGVLVTDDQAAFRHPELAAIADPRATNGYRPLTDLEREISSINDLPQHSQVRFNELDGEIGMIFLGGGAGYLVLDWLRRLGASPANTMDGTSSPHDEESLYRATRALLRKPGLKALIAASNYGNFRPIDARAKGVIRALAEAGVDGHAFPVLLRFDGEKLAEARAAAEAVPGLEYLDAGHTLEDAAKRIVARLQERRPMSNP